MLTLFELNRDKHQPVNVSVHYGVINYKRMVKYYQNCLYEYKAMFNYSL